MALHDDEGSQTEGQAPGSARGMIPRDQLGSMGFLPRVRWHIWLPILLGILMFSLAYWRFDQQREARVRARLLSEHTLLTAELAPRYREVRSRIERLAFTTVGAWQGSFRADGFTLEDLSRARVIYGRMRLGEVSRREDVDRSIRRRFPDQVATCLGLDVAQAYEFFRKGDFLMPTYIEGVQRARGSDRLRALRGDLEFRLRRDTHDISEMSGLRYFVLSVDEAALSIEGPTRVYIWDLRDERLLLRARGAGDDAMVIPVQIAGITGRPQPSQSRPTLTVTEHDCSVAGAVRSQLGAPAPVLPHAPEAPAQPTPPGSDGGAPSDSAR